MASRGNDADLAMYREVGARIRKARAGRKQQQLAIAVGLTRTSITNIEQGRQKILLHTFLAIAAALGVPPAQLLPDGVLDGTKRPGPLTSGLDAETKRFVEEVVAKAVSTRGSGRKR